MGAEQGVKAAKKSQMMNESPLQLSESAAPLAAPIHTAGSRQPCPHQTRPHLVHPAGRGGQPATTLQVVRHQTVHPGRRLGAAVAAEGHLGLYQHAAVIHTHCVCGGRGGGVSW